MNRQVNLKDIVNIIDEKIEGLNQQNGMGSLMALAGWANDNVNTVIESNKKIIKELTDLRMKVLEIYWVGLVIKVFTETINGLLSVRRY